MMKLVMLFIFGFMLSSVISVGLFIMPFFTLKDVITKQIIRLENLKLMLFLFLLQLQLQLLKEDGI